MQRINKIAKYTNTEVVREYTTRKTYKHNKFNKEFTQHSWATSPSPAFSGDLSIMSSKTEFYNSELNLSLTHNWIQ